MDLRYTTWSIGLSLELFMEGGTLILMANSNPRRAPDSITTHRNPVDHFLRSPPMADADDLAVAVAAAAQRRHLADSAAAESDLDLAFRLQLEEALAASAALAPSSSSPPPTPAPAAPPASSSSVPADESLSLIIALQTLELHRFEDASLSQSLHRDLIRDLRRREHDERFARELDAIPDRDWELYGDEVQRPMEAESKSSQSLPFRLYFKGMTSGEGGVEVSAVGAAVCDPGDKLLFKIQKPLPEAENSREVLEAKALIECLEAAASLGIRRVHVFCDHRPLLNHVTGKWAVKQRKVANLIGQVVLLQSKFESCKMFLLPRCYVRFVFLLARAAIDLQITKNTSLDGHKNLTETCSICLEVTDPTRMFTIDGCLHNFCFSCMRQHVEVKLLHGLLPGCPHVGCNTRLTVESSKKFLSPKLLDIMVHRIKEASIPATEKVYCPYPKCSALMSTSEAIRAQLVSSSKSVVDRSGHRLCIKCKGSFCINCKVPWHDKVSCHDYKRLNPHARVEERRLQSLAKEKLWRQCSKCNHMIELAEGCFHMTCRCGYEFCYTCGAEWKDKKATCACPLWDEGFILDEDTDFDDWDDSDDYWDEEDDEDDYDDDGGFY